MSFFSFTHILHAPHHWYRSDCSQRGKHYTTEKKTRGYVGAVLIRPNTPPTSLYFTYHTPPPQFFSSLLANTGSTQAGAQTSKALRLGKMQTYPTPSGFGRRECSDGLVCQCCSVPWTSSHSGCQKVKY